MYEGMKHMHSGLRWVVLILLIGAIANAFKKKGQKSFTVKDKLVNLLTLISAHTMLLIGLILYFISPKVQFSGMMADAARRFYGMEHLIMMVLGIALITIGYSKSKKKSKANGKHRVIFLFYTIALVVILAGIPWPFRTELGGAWF